MWSIARGLAAAILYLLGWGTVFAGAHTWDVNEIFSNADGSVWFIELVEAGGGTNEVNVGGRPVTSTTNLFTIADNVASPTSNRHLLFANPAFAALPGAPTPDQIVNIDSFFSVNGDTITYSPYDSLTFVAGQLPVDGIDSLNKDLTIGVNSPTNYANETGTVDAGGGGGSPPGVPDGAVGSMPMTVDRLAPDGTQLSIAFDTATCGGAADHNIIYGQGTQIPALPGGTFDLTGAVCAIGVSSPFMWNSVPDAADGTGLLWWLIVASDGSTIEGPWGKSDGITERQGPGTNGSSQQCGVTDKDTANTCGH